MILFKGWYVQAMTFMAKLITDKTFSTWYLSFDEKKSFTKPPPNLSEMFFSPVLYNAKERPYTVSDYVLIIKLHDVPRKLDRSKTPS